MLGSGSGLGFAFGFGLGLGLGRDGLLQGELGRGRVAALHHLVHLVDEDRSVDALDAVARPLRPIDPRLLGLRLGLRLELGLRFALTLAVALALAYPYPYPYP